MQIDGFLNLVRRRRSIRRFKPDPIPDEYIEKILEAARWAMSGANSQPWELIVVRDQGTKNKLADAYLKDRWEFYAIEQTLVKDLRHPQYINPPTQPGFREAPVLVVVCGDRRTVQATVLGVNFLNGGAGTARAFTENLANATHNIHLAAAALGLGAQWVTISKITEETLKSILEVPSVLELHTIIALGYPAYQPQAIYRRKLNEFVHYEKYDHSKFRSATDVITYIKTLRNKTKPAYHQAKEISEQI